MWTFFLIFERHDKKEEKTKAEKRRIKRTGCEKWKYIPVFLSSQDTHTHTQFERYWIEFFVLIVIDWDTKQEFNDGRRQDEPLALLVRRKHPVPMKLVKEKFKSKIINEKKENDWINFHLILNKTLEFIIYVCLSFRRRLRRWKMTGEKQRRWVQRKKSFTWISEVKNILTNRYEQNEMARRVQKRFLSFFCFFSLHYIFDRHR